jgi:hypothetical protein
MNIEKIGKKWRASLKRCGLCRRKMYVGDEVITYISFKTHKIVAVHPNCLFRKWAKWLPDDKKRLQFMKEEFAKKL